MHLGLCAASAVIAAPSSPDGSTDALRCPEDLVSCNGPSGVRLPRFGVLAGWDDRGSPAGGDRVMALAGVEGPVGSDAGDLLPGRDLVEQLGQHGRVAHIAGGELGRPNLQRLLVDPDVDLAPDASFRATVLAGVPLPFALDLDPGAVDQQVQGAVRAAVGDVHLQGLLAPRQGAEVGHCPVQAYQPQQALDEPGRLPERHAEEDLYGQTGLDGCVAVIALSATLASGRGFPSHGGVEPDRQRATALERLVVGGPVPGLVGRGCRSAHADQLPRWIHKMNPLRLFVQQSHINGDPTDNRIINLRACAQWQNAQNRGASKLSRPSETSSKYCGVRQKRPGNWVAMIWAYDVEAKKSVPHWVGGYDTEVAAAKAYDEAALRLHGDFAKLNFPLTAT